MNLTRVANEARQPRAQRTPVRILIADDHPLFRKGLRQTIETEATFRLIGEAGDGETALRAIRDLRPDVCILDVNMPVLDGLAVVRRMHTERLRGEVVILTMYKEEDLFNAAMDLGVNGYVLKECAVSDIIDCVRTVRDGHHYISPNLTDLLLARRAGAEELRHRKPGLDDLTPTERRILKQIAEDKTSKEIAADLGLSSHTVENHRTNICGKLDVHGIHGLVKFAYDNKSRL